MGKKAKHRFSKAEAEDAFKTLSTDERHEYFSIDLTGGISVAGNERMRELETLAYSRLKEKQDG